MDDTATAEADEQICFIYRLKAGCEQEYDRLHREVWPEILERIRARGVRDYSIFRRGLLIISVMRRPSNAAPTPPDPATEMIQEKWNAAVAPLFEKSKDDDGNLLRAERIFRLD